jgi:anti-sigma regulatory factor (Ser/Thr protein kinase)
MDSPAIEIRFPGTLPGFEQGFARLRGALDAEPLDPGTRFNVELVFEEIVANIVRHGSTGVAEIGVAVSLQVEADAVVMTFDDDGRPFDPSATVDPALPRRLEDAPVGGLGLMLVRRAASGLRYERTPGDRNHLTVTLPAAPRRAAV